MRTILLVLMLSEIGYGGCLDKDYPGVSRYVGDYFKSIGVVAKWEYFPVTMFPYFYSREDTCKVKFWVKYLCGGGLTVRVGFDYARYQYLQVSVVTKQEKSRTYYLFFFWRDQIFLDWHGVGATTVEVPSLE